MKSGVSTEGCRQPSMMMRLEALVTMMLRDACLILYFIEMEVHNEKIHHHCTQFIGRLGFSSMYTDIWKLENQIPWWVTKLLISSTYDDVKSRDEEEGALLLRKFFRYFIFGDNTRSIPLPWEEGREKEPLHFLEAVRAACFNTGCQQSLSCPTSTFKRWRSRRKSSERFGIFELIKHPFRSATELKAKGILFKRSSELKDDIKFSPRLFHGVLHLPVLIVDSVTTTYFSNFVVMETSPGSTRMPVTSYVNFMKSLIQTPEDAKLLQENGIIISFLQDSEHIVKLINEIDTHGGDDISIFEKIKKEINEHCDSRAKTWIAELIHTNFRSPWSVAAFLAATFGIFLALLQTYYTVNPRSTPK